MASKGKGGDFNYQKAAAHHLKQDRQEQKARKAGKAERAAQA